MTTITIALPEDLLLQLQETAARLRVTPQDLVRVSIKDLLTRPDEAFKQAAEYILNKNVELHRRLA